MTERTVMSMCLAKRRANEEIGNRAYTGPFLAELYKSLFIDSASVIKGQLDASVAKGTIDSIQAGDDPMRYAADILFPEFAVLGCTPALVGALPRNEQDNIVQRIEPCRHRSRYTESKGKTCCHEDLPEVVDMARNPPEAAEQECIVMVPQCTGLYKAEKCAVRHCLEIILLHICPAGEYPPGIKDKHSD